MRAAEAGWLEWWSANSELYYTPLMSKAVSETGKVLRKEAPRTLLRLLEPFLLRGEPIDLATLVDGVESKLKRKVVVPHVPEPPAKPSRRRWDPIDEGTRTIFLEFLLHGLSRRQASRRAWIPRSTLQKWIARGKEDYHNAVESEHRRFYEAILAAEDSARRIW